MLVGGSIHRNPGAIRLSIIYDRNKSATLARPVGKSCPYAVGCILKTTFNPSLFTLAYYNAFFKSTGTYPPDIMVVTAVSFQINTVAAVDKAKVYGIYTIAIPSDRIGISNDAVSRVMLGIPYPQTPYPRVISIKGNKCGSSIRY